MRLNRDQQKLREALLNRIEREGETLRDAIAAHESSQVAAIEAYNATMKAAHDHLTKASKVFLDAMTDVRDEFEQIGGDLRGAWEEKSEKWQDGDKGQQASAWIEKFEDAELPEYADDDYEPLTRDSLSKPEDLDLDLGNLPEDNDEE